MKRPNYPELIFVGLAGILTALAVVKTFGFTPKGKTFPLIIGVVLLFLLIVKLISLFSPRFAAKVDIHSVDLPSGISTCGFSSGDKSAGPKPTAWSKELSMIGWLFFLIGLVYLFGFAQSVPFSS